MIIIKKDIHDSNETDINDNNKTDINDNNETDINDNYICMIFKCGF